METGRGCGEWGGGVQGRGREEWSESLGHIRVGKKEKMSCIKKKKKKR